MSTITIKSYDDMLIAIQDYKDSYQGSLVMRLQELAMETLPASEMLAKTREIMETPSSPNVVTVNLFEGELYEYRGKAPAGSTIGKRNSDANWKPGDIIKIKGTDTEFTVTEAGHLDIGGKIFKPTHIICNHLDVPLGTQAGLSNKLWLVKRGQEWANLN